MPKQVLVTGFTGYVGRIIDTHLASSFDLYGISRKPSYLAKVFSCDVTSAEEVNNLAREIQPEVIIYAAGNKDVAYCENNHHQAYEINGFSVANFLEAFPGSRFIYISSDYVFDGQAGNYREESRPAPRTVYGKSKLVGELIGLKAAAEFVVLRISALFDRSAQFPRYILTNLQNNEPIECYKNTRYSPTYYDDFIKTLAALIDKKELGARIFHCCGEPVSRWEFAYNFAKVLGLDADLVKGSDADLTGRFLYPDLSLNDDYSRNYLGLPKRTLLQTLDLMKGDMNHDT